MTAAYFRPTVFLLGLFTVISGFSLWEGQQVTRRHEDPATVTETVRNFLQCKNLCDRRSSCKSVYYDTSTRECTSNFREFVIPEEDLASHVAGVVFSEKSVVTQVWISRGSEVEGQSVAQTPADVWSGWRCFHLKKYIF